MLDRTAATSPTCSSTTRVRTSGGNLFIVLLKGLYRAEELEFPTIPVWLKLLMLMELVRLRGAGATSGDKTAFLRHV